MILLRILTITLLTAGIALLLTAYFNLAGL